MGSQSASVTLAGVQNSELTDMGAALSSVPLCSRMAGDGVDNNNNLESEPDNNLTSQEVVQSQPAPVQTSTPKLEREREPAEDSLDFGPGSDRTTFGSDSGLEHSGPVTTEDVVSNTRCVDASFTVSSGGEKHVICGTNSGHHIMLDAEESCNTLGLLHNETEAENNQKYLFNYCCVLIGQFCFETFIKNSFGLVEQLLGISESVRSSVMPSGDHVQDAPSGSQE